MSCTNSEFRWLAVSATLLGVSVASLLAVLKYITWIVTGSVSIELNFVDSCLDVAVSLVNLLATVLSFRNYKRYAYGYDKITVLAAMFQMCTLLGFAYTTAISAFAKINSAHVVQPSIIAVASLLVSSILTILLINYQQRVIDKTGHLVVYVDRIHYSMDIITNASMLLYFLVCWYIGPEVSNFTSTINNFDSALAIFLSLYVTACCLKILVNVWKTLMDRRLCPEREKYIAQLVCKVPEILNAHVVRSRFSGVREFCEVSLSLHPSTSVQEALATIHRAREAVHRHTKSNVNCVFTIEHPKPVSSI